MSEDWTTPTYSAYNFPLLIKQLLISPIARASKNNIVDASGVRYGYPELLTRVAAYANMLENADSQPDDTVAIMDWDSHRYLEAYFAIPMSGRVLQTINIRLSPMQIAYTLNHSGARVLIIHSEFLPVLEAIRGDLEHLKQVIYINEGELKAGEPDFYSLLNDASTDYVFPDFEEDKRATIFYTSGTTGMPKGVFYSHRQMVLHALAAVATFGAAPQQGRFHADDVYMPITPLFHAHAWGFPYSATMLGNKQVYPGRYQPDVLLKLIREEGVTFSHCVATVLQMILEHPDSEATDLSKLKLLIGGGALPEGLARAALARGIDIFTGYGMSETGPLQTINHLTTEECRTDADEQVNLRIRTGRPVLLSDVRTVDSDMNFLPRDGSSAGEVVFRSPWLTQNYWRNPEASEELWRGGWLHSNDIGVLSPNGSLQITDRLKDVIKSGGEWVSSLELESLISRHQQVQEVAVIAESDPRWGERPVALIVLRDNAAVDAETIIAHVQQFADTGKIPKYAVPKRVQFVESLDRTSVGKLDKKVLRSKYAISDTPGK